MNKKSLIICNIITFILLIGLLVKEHYPQKIFAKFRKQPVVTDHKIYYWLNRDKLFEALPRDTGSIIFLGTSLTENFELNELLGRCNIKNRGITADKTEGILNRLQPIIEDQPKKLFLEAGVNDLGKGVSIQELISNYNKILDRLQKESPGTQLFIQNVLPVSNTGEYPAYNNPKVNADIKTVNKELLAIAEKRKLTYIDLYSKFELNGEINPKYVISDGIHLTGPAYAVWTEILRPYIQ